MNAVNWGTKLRHGVGALGHGVGASWNRPHEVDSKVPQLQPQLQPQLPNPEIANLKLRLKLPELRRELRHELKLSWRSLKHPIEVDDETTEWIGGGKSITRKHLRILSNNLVFIWKEFLEL